MLTQLCPETHTLQPAVSQGPSYDLIIRDTKMTDEMGTRENTSLRNANNQ